MNTKTKKLINFTGKRKIAMIFSAILMIASIGSLIVNGLNLGVDFTGGTVIEVGYKEAADVDKIRESLTAANFDASVQHFGTAKDVLIRIAPHEGEDRAKIGDAVFAILKSTNADVELRRVEFVGPQIGDELRDDGGTAMLLALAGILIYVTLRFEFRFSVGAIVALIHDVVITVGIFSITRIEFDLTILAAILAIIGYSLNDTIVVFDRVRENFLKLRKATAEESINTSINQTLSRTIVTSLTTLLVLTALFYFGGKIIHGFSLAMIIGVIVGTYSSIFVASSSLLMMGITREALLPPEKEADDQEELPDMP
ncbi:protein translocase subunit SecF [Cocleimonas flava]|jgi:preprotein translocase subunit SecF|uniref:Protein-export membrane protein SecF n=1 Tax=Cocleimonas flava TaxID=634765 RepID=A0A4R1F252_9GAMM|nr:MULTISPECIES: protein translocase subunit SecF [Cocleimonas]MEB8434101.1 protein translocase subunit SecF [Cocleimonas sp. KMM 6892]MEC4717039.1 protein translocase subunit SecF [Cocleimonas sp. KMM 6895]MEC4746373.1 protein translocase subunit SecF [Cocleimonas sp. KMM 6896]TCJ88207.1 protein translocase subunit secF [Cocleimonas flava]